MSGIDNGNPNPTPSDNGGEYDLRDCPFCGESVKLLPNHLPDCPAEGNNA